jgi:hypothetical protein
MTTPKKTTTGWIILGVLSVCVVAGLCGGVIDLVSDDNDSGTTPSPAVTVGTAPAGEIVVTEPPDLTIPPDEPNLPDQPTEEDPAEVYYPNCAAARAAGAAPLHRGEPGYSRKLDRDGDGVACE